MTDTTQPKSTDSMGQASVDSTHLPSADVIRRLAISGSGFIFDPNSGHHFTVNETGLEILQYLQKNHELSGLYESLKQEYDVDERELERDVMEFAGVLRDFVGE